MDDDRVVYGSGGDIRRCRCCYRGECCCCCWWWWCWCCISDRNRNRLRNRNSSSSISYCCKRRLMMIRPPLGRIHMRSTTMIVKVVDVDLYGTVPYYRIISHHITAGEGVVVVNSNSIRRCCCSPPMMLLLLSMTMIPLQYAATYQYCTIYIAYSEYAVMVGPILLFVICCFCICHGHGHGHHPLSLRLLFTMDALLLLLTTHSSSSFYIRPADSFYICPAAAGIRVVLV